MRAMHAVVGASAVVAVVFGCDVPDDRSLDQAITRSFQPPAEIDIGTVRFTRRGPVRFSTSGAALSPRLGGSEAKVTREKVAINDSLIESLSIEEFANKLRRVVLIADHEYVEAVPNLDLARRIRQRVGIELVHPGQSISNSESVEVPVDDSSMYARLVLGSDERTTVFDTTPVPFKHDLAIRFEDSGRCSATLIGWNTATSAAHCFYDSNGYFPFNTSGTGISLIAAGANASRTPPNDFPFGKNYCFTPLLMQGWFDNPDSTENNFFDMAVMTFELCGTDNPTRKVGFGSSWFNYGTPGGAGFSGLLVYGYPGTCPGLVTWPQACGTAGSANIGMDGRYIGTNADTSGGQSGTGYKIGGFFGPWYTIGSHKGGLEEIFDDWNFGRRYDDTYISLINLTVDFAPSAVAYGQFMNQNWNYQGFDWDEGFTKGDCAEGWGQLGMSEEVGGIAHKILCRQNSDFNFVNGGAYHATLDVPFDDRRATRTVNGTTEWAPGYWKLECGIDEYVSGSSQSIAADGNHFHGIKCSGAAPGKLLDHGCYTRVFDYQDSRGEVDSGEWDSNHYKAECRRSEYIAGVSVHTTTFAPHSLLCCAR